VDFESAVRSHAAIPLTHQKCNAHTFIRNNVQKTKRRKEEEKYCVNVIFVVVVDRSTVYFRVCS